MNDIRLERIKILKDVNNGLLSSVEGSRLIEELYAKKAAAGEACAEVMSFIPAWKSENINEDALSDVQFKSVLVFDIWGKTSEQFINELSNLVKINNGVAVVKQGESFVSKGSNCFEMNIHEEEDYGRLFKHLSAADMVPELILYLWPLTMYNGKLSEDSGISGFYPLFHITRHWMKAAHGRNVKLIYAYPSNKEQESAYHAAAGGFVKSVYRENPAFQFKSIGFDTFEIKDSQLDRKMIKLLVSEACSESSAFEVRYTEKARLTRGFEYYDMPQNTKGIPLKENGTYLITGGMGGLGFLFAKYIAKRAKVKIALLGRADLDGEKEERLEAIKSEGSEAEYFKGDVNNPKDVKKLLKSIRSIFGEINGVFHCAGVQKDSLIKNKNSADIHSVLLPKIVGTQIIDRATSSDTLDFFILFSSVAAVTGNPGQCDYAYSNAFMDGYAIYREQLREQGLRNGKTISVNWPLWEEGGMKVGENQKQILSSIGIKELPVQMGFKITEQIFGIDIPQITVVYGEKNKLLNLIKEAEHFSSIKKPDLSSTDKTGVNQRAEAILKEIFSNIIKMPESKIDMEISFEDYGLDSIMVTRFNNMVEMKFGTLSKTILYEYNTLRGLAGYLAENYSYMLNTKATEKKDNTLKVKQRISSKVPDKASADRISAVTPNEDAVIAGQQEKSSGDIAIIGVSGLYPDAPDIDAFWNNLKSGKDSVTEIPLSRWNKDEYYDPDPDNAKHGKIYGKWGAFVDNVDKFDALFFNISPREAELMDPQERLFLQTAWAAMDDAGYLRNRNKEYVRNDSKAKVGVFVGVTTNTYLLWGPDEWNKGNMVIPNSLEWSVANRVSYLFNFYGPSVPVDTACSSSLTAVHLACESIRKGECKMAIAGGVNLYLHPSKYISMCQLKMLSQTGRCHAFGAGGDGFVPGEGVGAIILKPLKDAVADRDHIYAVIKGSAVNHGGKTSGYTVPSPNAQASLILDTLENSGIHPGTISYIEAHGTGTALGDPIEITGLTKAYEVYTKDRQYCAIGSVKSNIGHLEAAAGIAGLTKVILQMKYKKLVPSLHCRELNPNIDFPETPFIVQTDYCDWLKPVVRENGENAEYPRRAAVSSFGAGGANAHIILEEYNSSEVVSNHEDKQWIFLLSAKDSVRLREYAARQGDFLEKIMLDMEKSEYETACHKEYDFAGNIAYTLTVGREAMDERLAVLASDLPELILGLREYLAGKKERNNWVCGNIRKSSGQASLFQQDDDFQELIEKWFEKNRLLKLAEIWCMGKDPGFERLYQEEKFSRVSLPSYPFAMERYWIPVKGTANLQKAGQPTEEKSGYKCNQEQILVGLYKGSWEKTGVIDLQNESQLTDGLIFVFDTVDDVYKQLNRRILDVGCKKTRAILVKPGEKFEKHEDGIYTVCPQRAEDFARLLEEAVVGVSDGVLILHFWPGSQTKADFDFIDGGLPDTATSLFLLTRLLLEKKIKGKLALLHACQQEKKDERPLSAAVTGFMKSILLENPRCTLKNLSIITDEKEDLTAEKLLDCCLGELSLSDSTVEVRIDGTERYIRIMEEVAPKRPEAGYGLKKDGVYLITGGAGGLGSIFAGHFASVEGIKIILSGRSSLNENIDKKLADIRGKGAEALYIKADISNPEQVGNLISQIKARFGKIDGVVHAAGINRDAYLLKKTQEIFKEVLAPKIEGTVNIDRALAGENLDFFIMFSSISAVLGNVGQCDYAYANAFMDSFAVSREKMRMKNLRKGRTISINWPLWQDGGMMVSENEKAAMYQKAGIVPMPMEQGLEAWEYCLSEKDDNLSVFYGCQKKIQQVLNTLTNRGNQKIVSKAAQAAPELVTEKSREFLQETFEEILRLPKEKMSPDTRFEEYGIDSITVEQFNTKMEEVFGELSKTLLYEYQTMEDLTVYITDTYAAKITEMYLTNSSAAVEQNTGSIEEALPPQQVQDFKIKASVPNSLNTNEVGEVQDDIAVIGISGRYPGAENLEELWGILKSGGDKVSEVPLERWDWKKYYHPDPDMAKEGKIYCKWGAFVENADKFDSLFFNISPKEARIIDPQERLFLETAWEAMEDAGYTRKSLKDSAGGNRAANVGVFAGVTTNTYQLYGPEEWGKGNMVMPNSLEWSIANRVSYIFNLCGPSMPVDTACSSSLTAIHLACESLRKGECSMALTGGVNLYLHPAKYLYLCQLRMLSPTGKCHTFGSEGDGFAPGEGVGAILLKPLKAALRDKDHIYGVIKGSAVNHGGNTSGYTVPNPVAQTEVITDVFKRFRINPESISYIEAHGTGTSLGDPIEIKGLTKAFQEFTNKRQFCSIGSVKSNIGHLEAAAGIAGLTKILLQMKYKKLVPSLTHSEGLNPSIDFKNTPFFVQQSLEDWTVAKSGENPEIKRCAGISSFGAGGANAHLVIEEYIQDYVREGKNTMPDNNGESIFVLSARNEARLLEYAGRYYEFLGKTQSYSLRDICYTLQVGREPMEERLAVIADSTGELMERLKYYLDKKEETRYIIRGRAGAGAYDISQNESSLENMAKAWVCGRDFKFETLYSGILPDRLSLPAYPFERDRCWIPISEKEIDFKSNSGVLHPMLDANESTFEEQVYVKVLSEEDFYIRDHIVENMMVLPGAVYIEMAVAAYSLASGGMQAGQVNISWFRPLALSEATQKVYISLYPQDKGAEFEVYTFTDGTEKNTHSSGSIGFSKEKTVKQPQMLNLVQIKERCRDYVEGSSCYSNFNRAGLHYKEAFNVIEGVWVGEDEALSSLVLPSVAEKDCENYTLHPSIIDGALQTVIVFMAGGGFDKDIAYLPYTIGQVEVFKPACFNCYAYASPVRKSGKDQNQASFNISIIDPAGNILVRIKDYTVRAAIKQTEKSMDSKEILEKLERGEIELEEAEKLLKI